MYALNYRYCGPSHRVTAAAGEVRRCQIIRRPGLARFDGPSFTHRNSLGRWFSPSSAGVNIMQGPVYVMWTLPDRPEIRVNDR